MVANWTVFFLLFLFVVFVLVRAIFSVWSLFGVAARFSWPARLVVPVTSDPDLASGTVGRVEVLVDFFVFGCLVGFFLFIVQFKMCRKISGRGKIQVLYSSVASMKGEVKFRFC